MSRTKNPTDISKLLNESIRSNPIWKNLFDKIKIVMDDLIEERANQLSRIRQPFHIQRGDYVDTTEGRGLINQVYRNPDSADAIDKLYIEINNKIVELPMRALHDRQVLVDGAALSGFSYFSDSLSDDDYGRVYQYINSYWSDSGDPNFIKFIGFIKNMKLDIFQLWTFDLGDNANGDMGEELDQYKELERFNDETMLPVWDSFNNNSGKYYPSSHVEIEYDYFISPDADLNDLINIFYYMAPIHLVLHRIVAAANAKTLFTYSHTVAQKHMYEASIYKWSANPVINAYGGFNCQFNIVENAIFRIEEIA